GFGVLGQCVAPQTNGTAKPWTLNASTCVSSVACVLTCRSGNRQVSFHLLSHQQATLALPHGLPKSHPNGSDISVALSFPSKCFHRLGQPLRRQPRPASPTAFEVWHDADEGFRQPAVAGP